jgi:hypothetical protein
MVGDKSHCADRKSAEHRLAEFFIGHLDLGQQFGSRAVLVFGCASQKIHRIDGFRVPWSHPEDARPAGVEPLEPSR